MRKILIVDDSTQVRKNLVRLIGRIKGYTCVGEAENTAGVIVQLEAVKPDIVILDINLTDENGIDILAMIKNISPSTIVIMFTNYSKKGFKTISSKLGAEYFLDKTEDIDKLITILTELAS